ncbi:DUF6049 family protein [Agromyces sp. NPDC058126]|uniref:DUF6049 family protein n=1 Tax=Agromyces sp. NPDC058126 TaxID=3346350 RepID=UPI0036D8E404
MAADSTPARARGDRLPATASSSDADVTGLAARSIDTAHASARTSGTGRRRGVALGIAAAAVCAVVAAPLGALAVAGVPDGERRAAPVPIQAPAEDPEGIALHIAPVSATTITAGQPLTVQVEVENATAEALAAGTLRLTRADRDIDDSDELDAWLASAGATDESTAPDGVTLGEAETRPVPAGSSTLVSFTVPASAIAEAGDAPVLGLGAELVVDDMLVASGTDAFATSAAPSTSATSVALVYPLTVPASSTGLFDAESLEEWTSPLGLLDRQLDAVAGRPVAIGVDPRIIASIRALGSSAPASAVEWLDRLGQAGNEIFPLAYADADVALQAQLGLETLLAPTGFADELDPADFPEQPAPEGEGDQTDETEAPVDGATATPAPGETAPAEPEPTPPAPGEVPSTEMLLEWPYTRTDIAWPADDTVAAGDLAVLDGAGLTTAILSPGNVTAPGGRVGAAASIDGSTAVVADARLTAPLREASVADSDTEWRSATGHLLAELALDSGDSPSALLATFGRDAGDHSTRVAATLDELVRASSASTAGLAEAIGAPPTSRALVDLAEDASRVDSAERMLAAADSVAEFSTVLDDPALLNDPVRRDLLAMLDVAWLSDRAAWETAVAEWLAARRATTESVSVVPSSSVNIFARETPLPVTVLNALPYPVTVVVSADPSNGRLVVEESVTATIPAESRSTVPVPITAGVGRGEVTIAISLSSPTGVSVGRTVFITGNVQADWEGLGAGILATALVLFFGFGIWRNIRRRRKQRAAEASGAVDAPVVQVADDTTSEPAGAGEADEPAATTEPVDEPVDEPTEASDPEDPKRD